MLGVLVLQCSVYFIKLHFIANAYISALIKTFMYKNRFGATDMFVLKARQIYHVTLTAHGSKQCKGKKAFPVETNLPFFMQKCQNLVDIL